MMFKKLYPLRYLFIIAIYIVTINAFSQQSKPLDVDMEIVASVKKDVWIPFMESYRDLDSKKLIAIHSPDITRNFNKFK